MQNIAEMRNIADFPSHAVLTATNVFGRHQRLLGGGEKKRQERSGHVFTLCAGVKNRNRVPDNELQRQRGREREREGEDEKAGVEYARKSLRAPVDTRATTKDTHWKRKKVTRDKHNFTSSSTIREFALFGNVPTCIV